MSSFTKKGWVVTLAGVGLNLALGILFTAWGVGGVFGPVLAGRIADATGSYELAYQIAAGLLVAASLLSMLSYVAISVNLPEPEITIKVGRRKAQPSAIGDQVQASG
jgi:MFS family permease